MIAPIEKPDEVPPAVVDEEEADDAEDGEPEAQGAGGMCSVIGGWTQRLTSSGRPKLQHCLRSHDLHICRRGQKEKEKEEVQEEESRADRAAHYRTIQALP